MLLDEIFAVGDQDFRKRSAEKVLDVVARGGSAIFVSHDLDSIARYCHKTLWLENGRVREWGPSSVVVKKYLESQR
jgi:ABC-type polysaccharide/polyol phosphate transport system ATPase subunit